VDSGVAELIAARAADDHPGLVTETGEWTWREVVAESAVRAAWLTATLDPDKPQNLGLLLGNTADYVFTLYGAALAGACVVGINSTRRGAELQRDIDHTDCQFVLTDAAGAQLLPDSVETLRVEDAPWSSFTGAALPSELPDPATLLLLIFTSGSTSAPKAVKRSSGRIAAAASLGFTPDATIYISMPLIHGNGLFGALFPGLAAGARVALREKFSASEWLPDVLRYQATFTTTVGRALSYVLATPPSEQDRETSLKIVLAPESTPSDADAFTARFGVPVVTGYGQSEGGITLLPSRRVGALGRAPEGTTITVLDPESGAEKAVADLDEHGLLRNPEQAIGELVRRDSTGAFEGYWANPDADSDRVRDGWYWSGDLAYRDADGVFYFAGRVGDWIRVDSENFAAAPIERILGRHPDVAAAAVVGVPDPHSGDRVLAVLEADSTQLDAGSFDPVKFSSWLAEQPDLGTKWAPTIVRVSSALPTVGIDKIDRRRLRLEAWLSDDPIWWRPSRDEDYRLMTDADRAALREAFDAAGRTALHPAGSA
jgi:fatty-acyl-CoA synthase